MTKDPCCPRHDALVSATMTWLRMRQTDATGMQQPHVWGHTPPLRTRAALPDDRRPCRIRRA
ncbi:hypothetical protein NX81_017765 [Xanthomonas vasicola]|uniref:hypothetical protein n=1 Tax=Xanthomonas vasicola TaxID=56459 RepID=UPI000F856431|nr:hypothetical protein [Xanthomonas vasicola]AZR23827.1 hypothetical protein NX81_017765 [Xanthomonas vasicola]